MGDLPEATQQMQVLQTHASGLSPLTLGVTRSLALEEAEQKVFWRAGTMSTSRP